MWNRIKSELSVALEVWAACAALTGLVYGAYWLIGLVVLHGPWAWIGDNWIALLIGLGVVCSLFVCTQLPRIVRGVTLHAVTWPLIGSALLVAVVFAAMFSSVIPIVLVVVSIGIAELRARRKDDHAL